MKLKRIHIENFGTLRNFDLTFTDGLNAHPMENGSGKSTLIAFLKSMLYGLSDSRSRDLSENERRHYLPWQGGTFGGSLILEHEEKTYRLVRRFSTRPSEDTLEVFDEDTGTRTDALGRIPGQTLFSMDAEGFSQCAVFSERSYAPQLENESVLARMGEEESAKSAADALALLAEERRQYERKGGRGILCETEDALAHAEEKHAMLQREASSLEEKERAFLDAKAALAALTGDAAEGNTPKKANVRGAWLCFCVAVLLASASLIGAMFRQLFLLGLLPAFALIIVGFFIFFANNGLQKQVFYNKSRLSLEKETKGMRWNFEERYRACADCERAYMAAAAADEEAALLKERIDALQKKKSRIESYLSDVKKAEEYLALAAQRYSEQRAAATHAFFEAHLHSLGVEDGGAYRLGNRFRVTFLENDTYREGAALSRGGKDRVTLARSLALLSALPAGAGLPLLLDDPFLSYDDAHLATALSALEALAKDRQILYLTCSHSRMP